MSLPGRRVVTLPGDVYVGGYVAKVRRMTDEQFDAEQEEVDAIVAKAERDLAVALHRKDVILAAVTRRDAEREQRMKDAQASMFPDEED